MFTGLKEVKDFSDQEKTQFYFTLDAFIREIKNRRTNAIAKEEKPLRLAEASMIYFINIFVLSGLGLNSLNL